MDSCGSPKPTQFDQEDGLNTPTLKDLLSNCSISNSELSPTPVKRVPISSRRKKKNANPNPIPIEIPTKPKVKKPSIFDFKDEKTVVTAALADTIFVIQGND
jgi:hypothetical protein